MRQTGCNYIGYTTSAKGRETFQAFSTIRNEFLQESFSYATDEELQTALFLAERAFQEYRNITSIKKAEFLNAIGDEIMALGDALIDQCVAESALPIGRITGERARTCNQLRMFAQLLRDGWWVDARIDTAQPERQPVPKADIRRMFIPVGAVAVFGASNFPLAFSTAGGDMASALSAGCPVIVKAHPSHPATHAMVSSAVVKAAQKTGMPEGVFSSLFLTNDQSIQLVQHPVIKAVGFTGSRHVGMLLFHAAVQRPDPIPVYAEMSAINPVILMEGALQTQGDKIAKDLAVSVTLGVGQFCTNPGLILVKESRALESFLQGFTQHFQETVPGSMLNPNICKAYSHGINLLENSKGVTKLATATKEAVAELHQAQAVAFTVSAEDFLANKELSHEVFGPSTLFVISKDEAQLQEVLQLMDGQLTATIHAVPEDEQHLRPIIEIVIQKAGRIIYGGYPTGVEVCHSMQHGGPFPATTDARSTSVGSAAIYRFVRPVSFQDFPDHLLPDELKSANPLSILRLVNNQWTKEPL